MSRVWSEQQEAIFAWFGRLEAGLLGGDAEFNFDADGNLIVRARAGTGKTTTIIEGIRRAPERKKLLCAFNKRIADELTSRISDPSAIAKTLHALGYSAVLRYWEGMKPCKGSERADFLTEKVCGVQAPDAIKRLVSKLHSKAREMAPHARNMGDLTDILYRFECEPDEGWDGAGFDAAYIEAKALEAMELAATVKPVQTGIDFADMIFLPVRNRWLVPQYDLVVVDEAQDMTNAQLEIAQGVCKGRICVVGDDRQAIYGFRGADSGSIDRLKKELKASELGLTVTYRCGKSIVALAQAIVPDFVAAPSAPEGVVEDLHWDKLLDAAKPGDFILSRINAPLVSVAIGLLKQNKRARIAGRDIGATLKNLLRKLKGRSIPDLLEKIDNWQTREINRLSRLKGDQTSRIDLIRDQAEMLIEIATDARSVEDVSSRIEALFTDDGLGQAGVITCSSIHRAKGLEAEKVFVLENTLRGGNDEEENIRYVAITRAKTHLVWVFKTEAA